MITREHNQKELERSNLFSMANGGKCALCLVGLANTQNGLQAKKYLLSLTSVRFSAF